MEEILMLKNVSVFYGEHPVLKDVNMGIQPGRILAVMGPSGSGKTTLLRALNGLLWEEPEAEMKGEICLLGRDTRTMDREELRRRVGLVFQTPQPFPFSIYKNMTYAPRYYGIRKKEQLEEIVREKLMMAGLYEEVKGELSKSALKLSGGQKQRLCIARALTAEPEVLLQYILKEIRYEKDLAGKKILVTAGPTREAIDPVRYITNHSTGKMGYAIAKTAAYRGAQVTLVTGPAEEKPPMFVDLVPVESAKEMFEAVTARSAGQDAIIKAAAVADYRPKFVNTEKTKKKDGDMAIQLERTDDILKWLGEHKEKGQFLCGFSMETEHMLENSRAKLEKKNLDMIVANNLKVDGAGFGTDTNVVTLITREKETELPKMSKEDVAGRILDAVFGADEEEKADF